MKAARCGLLLLGMLGSALLHATTDMATVRLNHRLADEVAALIRPLLEPGETVVPTAGLLIIKAAPENIDHIRSLIEQVDTPQRRLLITVAQGRGLTREALGAGISSLNVQSDGRRTRLGGQGHLYQTETQSLGDQVQRVQTMDGQPAIIRFGEQVPLPTHQIYGYGPYGAIAGSSSEYRDIDSGFAVTPRLAGDTVTLDISPWSSRMGRRGDGSIDTQSAQTTVRIGLGEWIELGGQEDSRSMGQTGLYGHQYSTRAETNRIFIRVDESGR